MRGHIDRRRHKQTDAERKAGKQGKPMFRQDGTAIWRARYPDPHKSGTAQIERSFATRKDAEDWLTERGANVLRGTHIDPRDGRRTFADLRGPLA